LRVARPAVSFGGFES